MTIGKQSLIPGERNTTPIKWTIRVWKSSWLKQLYAWCKCVVMLWFVARNTLIVHSERLLPSVMRQWQFLIPHESMMWFVIVHLLVGTPWVSWLLGDGLCLVFHLLSCLAHQICIILVFQRGGSWAVFFPAARCLTYSTLFTWKPRRFFTPSPDEGCRSVKGTVSASAPPIDECG